jgi:PTS system mannose-specific IIB component
MVSIIIGSHGKFAEGIKHASFMVMGEQDFVQSVSIQPEGSVEGFETDLRAAVDKLPKNEEILMFADLFGGTPYNVAVRIQAELGKRFTLIVGMNLPMLLDAYGTAPTVKTSFELAKSVLATGKDQIKSFPEIVTESVAAAAPAASGGGTLTKEELKPQKDPKSKLDIKLVRLDSRLLHGQVAIAWTKQINPSRILVVSDSVAKDEIRKSLLIEAAPPGVKVNVIPIAQFVAVYHDPRIASQKLLVLFENIHDLKVAIDKIGDFNPKEINVGSMAHSEGKTQLNQVLSADKKDADAFVDLIGKGYTFQAQKVPTDGKTKIEDLLKRGQLI